MPKLIRRLVRYVPTPADQLADLPADEAIPPEAPIAIYTGAVPRRATLLRTAALLTANGFTVTAPAAGGGTTPAPNVTTITAINFASAGTIRANSAVGTVLGTLSTSASATLANVAFSLVTGAPLAVKIVGSQVQLNSATVPAGDLTFRVRATADNAEPVERVLTVTISPAVMTAPTAPTGPLDVAFRYRAQGNLPARSPIIQNTMLRRLPSGAIDSIRVTRAMQADIRITPVNSSVEVPPSAATPPRMSRRASRYKSIETATAPSSAAPSTTAAAYIMKSANRAPTEAPAEIPST